jgi:hypothetical protein
VSRFGMLMRSLLTARLACYENWAGVVVFTVGYVAAILINATFDVTLEEPMPGIWFWCLCGLGIESVMIYRAQPGDQR